MALRDAVAVVGLRRLEPDDWRLWREVRLRALADAPEAFSSLLADWQGDGDTAERWHARLVGVPFSLIAIVGGEPVGQVSATEVDEHGDVQLLSMWVAPEARGTGASDVLVNEVIAWAIGRAARTVSLDVRHENDHAIALYRRHGFVASPGTACDDPTCARMVRPLRRPVGGD